MNGIVADHGPGASEEETTARGTASGEEEARAGEAAPAQRTLLPLPVFFYAPDTRWAAGASLLYSYRRDPGEGPRWPTVGEVSVIVTQNEQVIAGLMVDHSTPGNRDRLSAAAMHLHFPEAFYGIGRDLPIAARESYTSRSTSLSMRLRRQVRSGLFVGGGYSLHHFAVIDPESGGQLAEGMVAGSRGGAVSSLSASLTLDTRDHHFAASRGTFAEVVVRRADRLLGSDFELTSYSLDARRYFPLGHRQVVAVQAFAADANGDVPFQMLPRMGGANLMRGNDPSRNRDRSLVAAQMEYRAPVWWRVGVVGFAAAGDVAPGPAQFGGVAPQLSGGAGLRYTVRSHERLNLRADYAFSQGARRLYLSIGEAF